MRENLGAGLSAVEVRREICAEGGSRAVGLSGEGGPALRGLRVPTGQGRNGHLTFPRIQKESRAEILANSLAGRTVYLS